MGKYVLIKVFKISNCSSNNSKLNQSVSFGYTFFFYINEHKHI